MRCLMCYIISIIRICLYILHTYVSIENIKAILFAMHLFPDDIAIEKRTPNLCTRIRNQILSFVI